MKSNPFHLRTAFGIIAAAAALSLTACSGQNASEPPAAETSGQPVSEQKNDAGAGSVAEKQKTPEEAFYAAYKEGTSDQDKIENMMSRITDLDWKTYRELRKDVPLMDETLGYLYRNRHMIKPEHYKAVFSATRNLDGAGSESYAALVSELFGADKKAAIHALSVMDNPNRRQSVIGMIAYGLSYKDTKQVKDEIAKWQADAALSSTEKEIVQELLKAVDHPY
ncbi:hypothetical protein [Paenibacillus sp. USDA918EY]|uniref:hypothetical protein n=1 Tax=Paenibacillus sp. USDA918EY TaxID=2689575 RepID=UPI001359D682|nr:hypothetical protein [Paenibacillus sp. USDA918EY]